MTAPVSPRGGDGAPDLTADLVDALATTLRMLEAAHRSLGMRPADNKRIAAARATLDAGRSHLDAGAARGSDGRRG